MEGETLTCPFCGAPYREIIPSSTVQVKCKYCEGTILVSAFLGGDVYRCQNHPEVLAIGLCNDCGRSYCDSCLYFYNVEHGTLHLCPYCFRERQVKRAIASLFLGVLWLLIGAFAIGVAPEPEGKLFGGVFLGFAFLFIIWRIYRVFYLPKGLTLKEKRKVIKRKIKSLKASSLQASVFELYNKMLSDSLRNYGLQLGWKMLEHRIDFYVKTGMTRSEAVRKLAEEKGY